MNFDFRAAAGPLGLRRVPSVHDVGPAAAAVGARGREVGRGRAAVVGLKTPCAFTTPESLADYLIEVLRRAGQRFFSDVLDDACTARDFFATRVDCKKLGFLAEFDLGEALSGSFLGREGPQKSTPYPGIKLEFKKTHLKSKNPT